MGQGALPITLDDLGWTGLSSILAKPAALMLSVTISSPLSYEPTSGIVSGDSCGPRNPLKLESDLLFLCLLSGDCVGPLTLTWMNNAPSDLQIPPKGFDIIGKALALYELHHIASDKIERSSS
jgi:hypothetical protein